MEKIMNLNTIKKAQENYFELHSEYAGELFVDLESNQIDEMEAINRLKKFNEIVTDELKSRFNDLEDDFDISDIIDVDNTENFIESSKFANESLILLYAIKYESIELLKYLYTEDGNFNLWSLPISPLEFAQKLELEKAVTFLRSY
jgi:hypothetical protein